MVNQQNINTLQLTHSEKEYLCYFTMLPSAKFTFNELCELFVIPSAFESDFFDIVYDLSKKKWLIRDNDTFQMPYNNRFIAARKLKPDFEKCIKLYDSIVEELRNVEDANNQKFSKYLNYAETFLQQLPEENLEVLELLQVMIEAFNHTQQSEKALIFNQRYIELIKKHIDAIHPELAISYSNMALNYSQLGEYQKAIEYNFKSLEIYEKLNQQDNPEIVANYTFIAINYQQLRNFTRSLEYGLKSIEIAEKRDDINFHLLGITYCQVALSYFNMNQYKQAVQYIDHAVELHKKILPFEHPDYLEDLKIQRDLHKAYKIYRKIPKFLKIIVSTLVIFFIALAIVLFVVNNYFH